MTILKMARTSAEAARRGKAGGIEDVETVLREQGVDVVIATLAPSHLDWDESAINAGAHRFHCVPERFRDAYYRAYAAAAREYAEELRAEAEAQS